MGPSGTNSLRLQYIYVIEKLIWYDNYDLNYPHCLPIHIVCVCVDSHLHSNTQTHRQSHASAALKHLVCLDSGAFLQALWDWLSWQWIHYSPIYIKTAKAFYFLMFYTLHILSKVCVLSACFFFFLSGITVYGKYIPYPLFSIFFPSLSIVVIYLDQITALYAQFPPLLQLIKPGL